MLQSIPPSFFAGKFKYKKVTIFFIIHQPATIKQQTTTTLFNFCGYTNNTQSPNKQTRGRKMRPPSMLLQSHSMLWLFCTTLMLFNIAADAQQQKPPPQPMGLGIVLKDGEVDLPANSSLITKNDQLPPEYANYNYNHNKTFNPCNVEITEAGIEVFYNEAGCTVDLVTKKLDQAHFVAKINDEKNCIAKANSEDEIVGKSFDNLIPFAIGQPNKMLEQLSGGPIYPNPASGQPTVEKRCMDNEKCTTEYGGKCIETTMLEIGWSRAKDGSIVGHLHQVGEPVSSWHIKMGNAEMKEAKMTVQLRTKVKPPKEGEQEPRPTMNYKISADSAAELEVKFGAEPEDRQGDQPVCNIPYAATSTSTRDLKSNDPTLNDKHLLSLHFFPQTATFYHGKEGNKWTIKEDQKPDETMPKCKGQSFFFPFQSAEGLLFVPPPPQPETTTNGTTEATTIGTTEATTIGTTEGTKNGTTEGTTNGSNATKEGGLPLPAIIGIVIGGIALIVGVGVLVYCLCCRAKDEADDEDEYADEEKAVAADDANDEEDKKEEPTGEQMS